METTNPAKSEVLVTNLTPVEFKGARESARTLLIEKALEASISTARKTSDKAKALDAVRSSVELVAETASQDLLKKGENYLAQWVREQVEPIARESTDERYDLWLPQEVKLFEGLCAQYTRAPKVKFEGRGTLKIRFAEKYSEDPSDMLAKLIDEEGLDYIEMEGEEAVFESVADEMAEELQNIIGVLSATHHKQVYISVDGGPFRPRTSSDPTEETWKPKAFDLPYEAYVAVCKGYGITPEKQRPESGWRDKMHTYVDQSKLISRVDVVKSDYVEECDPADYITHTYNADGNQIYRLLNERNIVEVHTDYEVAQRRVEATLKQCPERTKWTRRILILSPNEGEAGWRFQPMGIYDTDETLESALKLVAG